MDQSTLISRVAARLNIDSNDPLYSSISGFVDEAIHHLETANPMGWSWMRNTITTTISAASYTFTQLDASNTIAKVLSVRVNVGTYGFEPLEFRGPDEINQLYMDTGTGLPESWWVENETLYVYPDPDASYTAEIRVLNTEDDLGGSGSSPSIPTVFHTGIIDCALMFAYQALGDDRKVTLQEQRVERTIARMRGYGTPYASSPRIRVREWL